MGTVGGNCLESIIGREPLGGMSFCSEGGMTLRGGLRSVRVGYRKKAFFNSFIVKKTSVLKGGLNCFFSKPALNGFLI